MEHDPLQVRMLGEFSLACGDVVISSADSRSKKVWMLLAYLVYHRTRTVTRSELVSLLLDDDEGSADPMNALKRLVHRARAVLDALWPQAGKELILWQNSRYSWNTDVPMALDVADFDALCRTPAAATDELLRVLALYRGDFLQNFSSEMWVIPISAYFHNQYLKLVLDVIPELEGQARHESVVRLCRGALAVEPYSEELSLHLLKNLVALGDCQAAVQAYEKLREELFSVFGILPSDEINAVYREAMRSISEWEIAPEVMWGNMRELSAAPGALICDFDYFRLLYQTNARLIARSGEVIHIALLSVRGKDGAELPRRSLELATDNLALLSQRNLRSGDVISRCSVSQVILMLPQANCENCRMVCERILRSFRQQHPHSPAQVSFSVHPLEPLESDAPRSPGAPATGGTA